MRQDGDSPQAFRVTNIHVGVQKGDGWKRWQQQVQIFSPPFIVGMVPIPQVPQVSWRRGRVPGGPPWGGEIQRGGPPSPPLSSPFPPAVSTMSPTWKIMTYYSSICLYQIDRYEHMAILCLYLGSYDECVLIDILPDQWRYWMGLI